MKLFQHILNQNTQDELRRAKVAAQHLYEKQVRMKSYYGWFLCLIVGAAFWVGVFVAPYATLIISGALLVVEVAICFGWRMIMGTYEPPKSPHETTKRITLR